MIDALSAATVCGSPPSWACLPSLTTSAARTLRQAQRYTSLQDPSGRLLRLPTSSKSDSSTRSRSASSTNHKDVLFHSASSVAFCSSILRILWIFMSVPSSFKGSWNKMRFFFLFMLEGKAGVPIFPDLLMPAKTERENAAYTV